MESREQRISTLATTLKSSGIAKSDSQARMMAEEMIGVEEHVQKSYEVEHAKAQEYLNTSKNLGRQVIRSGQIKPLPQPESQPVIQSIPRSQQPISQSVPKIQELADAKKPSPEYTDVNFGSKPLSQAFADHDTHNPAIEAIKAQVQTENDVSSAKGLGLETYDVDKILEEASHEPTAVEGPKSTVDEIPVADKEPEPAAEEPQKGSQLDTQKLVEMMEEDGKLEEHTREIKEKPKDVKPKEAYVENSIDLSNMFDFNKR